MASNRANLQTIISADASQFSATMRRAQTMASRTGAGIGRSIGSASSAIAGLGASAAKATLKIASVGVGLAAAAATASLFKGVRLAADIEQMAISFEVMTGSAEEGKRVLEEIRKFGAETPYEFPSLAKGVQTMLAFGISAEDAMKNIKMLGDIAAGDGQKLESLSLVFGQIASTGRLMGGDLLQLINAGFNPLQEISAKTGESMVALKKRMEAGLIPFSEVQQAFVDATSAGGKFFGMTARQSTTFNGRMSTMMDSINIALTNMGTPLLETFMPYIEKATLAIDRMGPSFIKMGEQVGRVIDGVLGKETISGALSVISTGMLETMKLVGVVLAESLIKAFGAALSFFKSAFENVTVKDIAKSLFDTFAGMVIGLAGEIISVLAGKDVITVEGAANDMQSQIQAAIDGVDWGLGDASEEALDEWKKTMGDLFPKTSGSTGPTGSTSESDLYDLEYEAQKKRIARDEELAKEAKRSAKSGGFPAFGTDYGPRDPFEQAGPSKSLANSAVADSFAKSEDMAASGFSGLSGLARMQGERAAGIAVGSGSSLSLANQKNPGGAFGRSSGLQTGSLGAKRTVGRDKENKKAETLQEKQASSLESIDDKLTSALTVG